MTLIAGVFEGLTGLDLALLYAFILVMYIPTAVVWTLPAGVAGAVAGARLTGGQPRGWVAGWCVGALAAGALALLGVGVGLPGWAAMGVAYLPVWVACAAAARLRRPAVS